MLGKPHPEQDRVGGRPGPPGRARVVRPFPRVGRSIPRATGGPDEWLLPPPGERGDRIRLTDLLRRLYLPGARAVLARYARCGPTLARLRRAPRTPRRTRQSRARLLSRGPVRCSRATRAAVQRSRGSAARPGPRAARGKAARGLRFSPTGGRRLDSLRARGV